MTTTHDQTYKQWVAQTFEGACERFLNEISHYDEDVSDINEQLLLLLSKIQKRWIQSDK